MAKYEKRRFDEQTLQKAYQTNLVEFAKAQGFELESAGRDAYHVKGYGGLYLFKHGHGWYQWSEDAKGDAVKFVQHMFQKDFVQAVYLLLDFQNEHPMMETAPPPPQRQERGTLVLPDKAGNYKRAYWYLCSVRGIEPQIVSKLMNEKKIYQQAERGNVVFVAYDRDNAPRYCAMRGTGGEKQFRMDVTNSDKSYPFHLVGKSDKVIVFESPIDAMSYASRVKTAGYDWTNDHYISMGGLADLALQRFMGEHPEVRKIIFALDNDREGHRPDGTPCNWGQEAAAKYREKYAGQGYTVENHVPRGKDWNDDLLAARAKEKEAAAAADEEEAEMGL